MSKSHKKGKSNLQAAAVAEAEAAEHGSASVLAWREEVQSRQEQQQQRQVLLRQLAPTSSRDSNSALRLPPPADIPLPATSSPSPTALDSKAASPVSSVFSDSSTCAIIELDRDSPTLSNDDDDFELVSGDGPAEQYHVRSDQVGQSSKLPKQPRPPFPYADAAIYRRGLKPVGNNSSSNCSILDNITTKTGSAMDAGGSNDYDSPEWHQAGDHATQQDLAGPGEHGKISCVVDSPQKEGEGSQNAYVSYRVTTDTDFKSFQNTHTTVRRRFTDFVFLYRTLAKEYPQCAVPPLPDKHNMSYVRGDRFGPEFTSRRAHSLNRFLRRLTLHPVLRRAALLTLFLETSDWNATMKSRPNRGMSGGEAANPSVLESWTDSFLNAFTKPHKTDKRFQEVQDRSLKLDDDLNTVSKTVARVAKREGDLETDYSDLAEQFQKLAVLEPGLTDDLAKFAASLSATSEGWGNLHNFTDQDYLGSLKDMEAYSSSIKSLLKVREQKQLDFEGLTEYLNKAAQERDTLASHGSMGASGFLRQKIEDVRGVDHEQSRRERQRKLEVQISRLQTEVESAKKTSEAFDEEVVKEVSDFERIKAVEFRDELGGLADANIKFHKENIQNWERFIADLEKEQAEAEAAKK